jgi:choline dehydrogenase
MNETRLRLHRRRRRLGRLRAREPAERGPACRVLLVEAGRDARHFWLRLPVGYFRSIYDPRFSWQFPLEPEAATGSRQVAWPRGKALGGSSVINGPALHPRPAGRLRRLGRRERSGAAGATARCCRSSSDRKRTRAARANGTARAASSASPTCATTTRTARRGSPPAPRPATRAPPTSTRRADGLGRYQLTLRGRWRCDAATAFLAPVRARPNLTIALGRAGHAHRRRRGQARGVEWIEAAAGRRPAASARSRTPTSK